MNPSATAPISEVRVCTNRTCRRDGASEAIRRFEAMVPRHVSVNRCGCLGRCGNGPNVCVLPQETFHERCCTTRSVSRVVQESFGGASSVSLERAWEMRELGNAAGESGLWDEAITHYDDAWKVLYEEEIKDQMLHVILSNRSTANLALGNAEGAMRDAQAAIDCAPTWHKGYIKLAQAQAFRGEWELAAEACNMACARESKLMKSPSFTSLVKEVRTNLNTLA